MHSLISKHRMLLFISRSRGTCCSNRKFQNIVCYCLSCIPCYGLCTSVISKHRMLLFIGASETLMCLSVGISKHRMLLFILSKFACVFSVLYFKTSYVTVYHYSEYGRDKQLLFQNIVCYCLSSVRCVKKAKAGKFQNIVCYCLSTR